MQRSLIIAAALAGIGASAFAQSSVDLYGRVNVTIERQKIGNTNDTRMQNNASRFGLRGSEDLGGGLKAGFRLEHGFNINDGRAAQTAGDTGQSGFASGAGPALDASPRRIQLDDQAIVSDGCERQRRGGHAWRPLRRDQPQ